jgi:hypothetical protein
VYEQVHERQTALDWLERARAAGVSWERFERSPFLKDLRKDPRYAAILK